MFGLGVTAVMIIVECLDVGMITVTKATMNYGMSNFVFPVYSNAFAAIFIFLPSSLIFYRKRSCHPLSVSIICRIFVLSLISCFEQTFVYKGMEYSSPTLASAISNLIPAFTFILSIISKMEKLDLRVKSSLVKVIGTVISIVGALTVTLYKGPAIANTSSTKNLPHEFLSVQTNWVIGGLLLVAGKFLLSLLFVFQELYVLVREEDMELCSMRSILPFVGMVIVILAQVSNMEVIKVAMSMGMNKYVIIVYSDALSSIIFLICSLIIHRSERPQLTFPILCGFFLLAVFGCSSQIFSFVGIQYSSPTLSTAMLNLIPAFTFTLAIIFRMEKLNWKSKSSQAKSLGALVSVAGAFVVTFYMGPEIVRTPTHNVSPHLRQLLSPQLNWVLGGFFLAAEAFLSSAWFILQAIILKKFPAVLIIMFYLFFFNTTLSTIFALIVVTNRSAWKLRLDMGLVATLYSAIIGTGFRVCLCTWCLSKTGPLYVSMFKPFAVVFSIVMDSIFLGEALRLGSLIGSVIIVTGFYAVMWGKSKEEETPSDCHCGVGNLISSSENVPLLQNRTEENYGRSSV